MNLKIFEVFMWFHPIIYTSIEIRFSSKLLKELAYNHKSCNPFAAQLSIRFCNKFMNIIIIYFTLIASPINANATMRKD